VLSDFKLLVWVADPIASNDRNSGRKSQNRRVEFAITANKKMIEEAQNRNKGNPFSF
jgi:hypothetical protein